MNVVKIFCQVRLRANLKLQSYFSFSIQNLNRFYFLNAFIVENIGVEPMTSCVQSRRSSQLPAELISPLKSLSPSSPAQT